MTLSRFLRDYVYVPLGGKRVGLVRAAVNVLVTFALGGLWHGASWLFVAWGVLHGLGMVAHRVWARVGCRLPKPLAWGVTFLFVNAGWVLFRAKSWGDAQKVFSGMLDFESALSLPLQAIPTARLAWGGFAMDWLLSSLPAGVVINLPLLVAIAASAMLLTAPNTTEMARGEMTVRRVVGAVPLLAIGILFAVASMSQVFLYFNF